MSYLLILFFILAVLAVIHSYILFPLSLRWLNIFKKKKFTSKEQRAASKSWPGRVSVIMSCYNEEAVLREKIQSLQNQELNPDRIHFFIGSDASDDCTNDIMFKWAGSDSRVRFYPYERRRGKGPVINELAKEAIAEWGSGSHHVLLFTDANVMLEPNCIQAMLRNFNDKRVGVVDSHMQSIGTSSQGISTSEKAYIKREVWIKHLEGELWGCMMGTFGGCYAVRSDAFNPVPVNFLVDDFFITMEAVFSGFGAVSELSAVCTEVVPQQIEEEYRRKRRIAGGNFQNLAYFWNKLWKASAANIYCFVSHKLLRWISPILLILAWFSAGILWLWGYGIFGWVCAIMFLGAITLIIFDAILEKWKLHWALTRHLRYFLWMNIALLEGFIQYLQGIETNVWQPPKRQ